MIDLVDMIWDIHKRVMDMNNLDSHSEGNTTPRYSPPRLSLITRLKVAIHKPKLSQIKLIDSYSATEDAATRETPSSTSKLNLKINIKRSTFCKSFKLPAESKYTNYIEIYSGRHKIYKTQSIKYGSTQIVKLIPTKPEERTENTKEFRLCKEMDHPYISNVYELFTSSDKIEITSEYCQGGEFINLLVSKKLTDFQAAKYIYQIALALNYLHSLNIAHRDIKPQNIMFTTSLPNSSIKLIDFDLCGKSRYENFHDRVGTLPFVAPEVLEGNFDYKCDIWSLGIIVYMMLRKIYVDKTYPFESKTSHELYNKILHYSPDKLKIAKYTLNENAKDILLKMLTRSPEERLTAAQVLSHPWLKQAVPPFPDLNSLRDIRAKLNKYKSASSFQKLIFYYATTQILSYETTKKASELFISIDRDIDSKITAGDLKLCMSNIELGDVTFCSSLLKSCSFGMKKYLTYSEFITAVLDWSEIMTEGMACGIYLYIVSDKEKLSKNRFSQFVSDQDIESIWTEAFRYLLKFPRDKVLFIQITYEEFMYLVRYSL